MSRFCAILACLMLVGLPVVIYGQSGNFWLKKGDDGKAVSPAKRGQKASESDQSHESVTPAMHTIRRTPAQSRNSDREQIESELQSVAKKMAAAGLVDESNEIQTILQRIREQRLEKLKAPREKPDLAIGEAQIVLTVLWMEVGEDAAALESLKELFKDVRSDDETVDRPPQGTITRTLSQKELSELLTLHNRGQAKIFHQQRDVFTNGCEHEFFAGSAVDLSASAEAGEIVQVATTENSSATHQEMAEALRRPQMALDGFSVCGSVEVSGESSIKLFVTMKRSSVSPITSEGEIPNIQSQQFGTFEEMEVKDGQSLAVFGLRSSKNVIESSRVPILSDIPGIGPRLFATKKIRTEQPYLLCLVTPKIVPQPENLPDPSGAVGHGNHTNIYGKRKSEASRQNRR